MFKYNYPMLESVKSDTKLIPCVRIVATGSLDAFPSNLDKLLIEQRFLPFAERRRLSFSSRILLRANTARIPFTDGKTGPGSISQWQPNRKVGLSTR